MPEELDSAYDGIRIVRRLFYDGRPDEIRALERERRNCAIAQFIYDLRHELKLTKAQFANRVGIKRTDVVQLEAADYNGCAEEVMRRVEAAFDRRFEPGRDGFETKPASDAGGRRV